MTGFLFDDELASFLTSGISIVVATRSAALAPHATRACGIRVDGLDRLSVLLPRATSAQAIANLEDNGECAVCASSPRNYRTIQLKGRRLRVSDGSPEDILWSQDQLRAFSEGCGEHGISRQRVRNLWLFESWCVEILVTSAYVQTPGPGAGATLGKAS